MRDLAVTTWPVRIPVTVWSQAAASTAIRVNVAINAQCAPFWDNVDSNGYTIAFGDGGGTALTWSRTAWDYANRAATLRVDYTTPAASTTTDNCVIYMYVGATAGADLSGSPANVTAKDAKPQNAAAFPLTLPAPSLAITQTTTPTIEVGSSTAALTTGEETAHLAPVGASFQQWGADTLVNGSTEAETPQWFRAQVYDSAAGLLGNWTDANQNSAAFVPGRGFGVLAYLSPDTEADARLTITVGTSMGYTHVTHHRVSAATPVII